MTRLLMTIVILFSLSQFVSSAPALTPSRQSPPVPTSDEIAKLSDSFLKSLREVGNIRRVNPDLLHPLFMEGLPCPVVPYVEASVCLSLSPEDRRDYVLATLNVLWLMYEYQLSQPVPFWLRSGPSPSDPLELFPAEVRPVLRKLTGVAQTIEAFKQLYADTKEAEAWMLARRSRITASDRSNFAKNAAILTEALRRNGLDSGDVTPVSVVSEGAFRYTRHMFVYIAARDRGVLKLISFTFVTK